MTQKFTAKLLKELPGPTDGRPYVIHYDSELPGFGLRVTRAGARSFVLNYRARGVERRMTIGSLPANLTAEETRKLIDATRKKAERLKSGAKYDGADPMAARHEDRAAATMADLAQRYIEEHAPKKRPRSQAGDKAMIDRLILPAMRSKRVADIRFADVDGLHRKVTKAGAPIMANRVVALLSKMFSLAVKWQLRADNPAKGVERNPEERRQRYLTTDELSRLSAELATHKAKASANAVRLLLLTGARRGEVLGAAWDQFDLGAGIWTKPSSHTKQKKEHRVPLSGPARQLLATMHANAETAAKKDRTEISPFVFPGTAKGKAQNDLKHFWASVCKSAKISGVRIHDIRHTYASVLASSGQTLPIIGQLLGHTNPNTTARYAHLFDDPLRAATEKAAKVINGPNRNRSRSASNVVELVRR